MRNALFITADETVIYQKVFYHGGRFFRVRFVIVERDGRFLGKIISCEAIEVIGGTHAVKRRYFLPISFSLHSATNQRTYFSKITFPFSKLEFFISQMPRAPARVNS